MKVPVNSIRAGNVIEYNGKLWVASKVQHISPGKGGAFVAIEAKAPHLASLTRQLAEMLSNVGI